MTARDALYRRAEQCTPKWEIRSFSPTPFGVPAPGPPQQSLRREGTRVTQVALARSTPVPKVHQQGHPVSSADASTTGPGCTDQSTAFRIDQPRPPTRPLVSKLIKSTGQWDLRGLAAPEREAMDTSGTALTILLTLTK